MTVTTFTEQPVNDLRIGQTICDMHGESFASITPKLAPRYRLSHPVEAHGEAYEFLSSLLKGCRRDFADNKALIVIDHGYDDSVGWGPRYAVCAYHYDNRRFGLCRLYDGP